MTKESILVSLGVDIVSQLCLTNCLYYVSTSTSKCDCFYCHWTHEWIHKRICLKSDSESDSFSLGSWEKKMNTLYNVVHIMCPQKRYIWPGGQAFGIARKSGRDLF